MGSNHELEKYVEFALSGAPEIKGDEKRRWLGEFRENVVFALTDDQIQRKDIWRILEDKIKDPRVSRMIVKGQVNGEIAGKLMEICRKAGKDYKTINNPDFKGDIAMILASHRAVDEDDIWIDPGSLLSDKFYHAKSNRLCKKHMEELKELHPQFADDFQELTFVDKLAGITCGICGGEPDVDYFYRVRSRK